MMVASDSSPERIISLFSQGVMDDLLPKRYQNLQINEYTGTTYPKDHLLKFENVALLQQFSDGVKCRMFLTTLGEAAQRWFKRLPENSIRRFKDFKKVFLHHFPTTRGIIKLLGACFQLNKDLKSLLELILRDSIR